MSSELCEEHINSVTNKSRSPTFSTSEEDSPIHSDPKSCYTHHQEGLTYHLQWAQGTGPWCLPEVEGEMNITVHDTLLCPVSFYISLDTNYKTISSCCRHNFFDSGFLDLCEVHSSAHQSYAKLIIAYMGRVEAPRDS